MLIILLKFRKLSFKHALCAATRRRAFEKFFEGYKKVGSADGKPLEEKQVLHIFDALWREGQFSDQWEQDCENYFSSLLKRRAEIAAAKQTWRENYQRIGGADGQPLETAYIDKLFSPFWKRSQYLPNGTWREAMANHFAAVQVERAERKENPGEVPTVKYVADAPLPEFSLVRNPPAADAWPRVDDASISATPVDLVALRKEIVEHRDRLEKLLMGDEVNPPQYPADYLKENGEKFIPEIAVMEKARLFCVSVESQRLAA